MFAILYTTVWFAGSDGPLTPKLGLDLRGGAQVILTPKSEDGKRATPEQLETAVEILRLRVNGAGVSEAEVKLEGSQILVQVPGGNRDSIASVTKAAQLQFRKLLACSNLTGSGGCQPLPPDQYPKDLVPTESPSATPAPTAVVSTPKPSASPKRRTLSAGLLAPTPVPTPSLSTAPQIVLSGDVFTPESFAKLNCSDPAALAGGAPANPTKPIVACAKDGSEKYHLDIAKVVGTDVKEASVGTDELGTTVLVNIKFKGGGQDRWTKLTIEACGSPTATQNACPLANTVSNRVAVVLDGVIYSSPSINEPIAGDAQISGNFTQQEARELSNVLKFGALPLTFVAGDTEIVSASLGDDQLRSGLLAGGIGLLAVVIYSLLYYRLLGLVTIASLLVSGGLIYSSIAILGDQLGFALSLAGIAGLIVSVGITADSFVVYFERLKDEVKEGRTPRSAVDRAWVRARRTILSADTVSILAAVILYMVSVGGVRGFAFTLGLSTLIDIIVVFLFTRPMISLMSRYNWFSRSGTTGFFGPDGGQPLTGTKRSPLGGPATTSVQEA